MSRIILPSNVEIYSGADMWEGVKVMMARRRKLSNPLALAVMALLGERAMHPYEMARLLRLRGKDETIKINYGSLYTVVQSLERHGFVEPVGTQREGRRPERTLYGLTPSGQEELHDWLADLVSVPVREFPAFAAALSMLLVLPLDEACELLDERVGRLTSQCAVAHDALTGFADKVPRIVLIESEYQLHMTQAEIAWIRAFREELAEGSVSGVAEWRERGESGEIPEAWRALEGGPAED
ncbi:PadR family transcriptional regulator [Streptomyces celluloflavus]|uniref:PadR family transcriptional regulator n=1 Tax=Streptomyces celluloflavus TaxID=58344 RepID=UPI0036B3AAF0